MPNLTAEALATPAQVNLWIFRDTSESVATGDLISRPTDLLEGLAKHANESRFLDALIAAGELECALSDLDDPAAPISAMLTDRLAAGFLDPRTRDCSRYVASLEEIRRNIRASVLSVSPPEGFAYYALHPLEFKKPIRHRLSNSGTAIIGIRSIGTVISAICTAGLRREGHPASRITVRPRGHPYGRVTEFNAEQSRWIRSRLERRSEFWVVDEGPGLSGSSFLSVGEALVQEGVPGDCITLIGTRKTEPGKLYAVAAEKRWNQFHSAFTEQTCYRESLGVFWGGGSWRHSVYASSSDWPASWPQMERLKFLSGDGTRLLKFEGFGRFGNTARDRSHQLCCSGFGPKCTAAEHGLTEYEFLPAKTLSRFDVSSSVLGRIADYCAFRASAFRTCRRSADSLRRMAIFNCFQEFEIEPSLQEERLSTNDVLIVDGQMQPHEWIQTRDGKLLKVDACSHGDDHFFPGPTDIAWDLAGAIVEWELGQDAVQFLISRYKTRSGDDPSSRLPDFLIAYGIFRLAYYKMAWLAVDDPQEQDRLKAVQHRYRSRLLHGLEGRHHNTSVSGL